MSDDEIVMRANKAIERAIDKKRINNTSIIVYDRKTKKIYNVLNNGDRIVVGTRINNKRYSEQINTI